MFRGLAGEFGIEKCVLKTTTEDGRQLKTVRLTLSHDFDDDLAHVLGKAGQHAQKALKAGDFEQATMPITAIKAVATMRDQGRNQTIEIPALHGLKAIGKEGSGDAEPPRLSLTFECVYARDAWVFFGDYAGQMVWVDLTPKQVEIDLGDDVKPRGKRHLASVPKAEATTIGEDGEPLAP
jgi:hypothetical protein